MPLVVVVLVGTLAAVLAGAVAPQLPFLPQLTKTPRRAGAAFMVAVLTTGAAVIAQNAESTPAPAKAFGALGARNVAPRDPDTTCGTVGRNESATARWGPQRPLYTIKNPAPRATLNSITDNPNYGDERTFLDVKDARIEKPGGFCGSRVVRDGDVLLLRAYVENSAADNLAGTPEGTARDVVLRFEPDGDLATLRRITATVTSSSTEPRSVTSVVELASDEPFRLDPIAGSGRVYSNARPGGVTISPDPWRADSQLGGDRLDGVIEPGYQFAVLVTYRVRVTRVG
jgi:hypothetical protein